MVRGEERGGRLVYMYEPRSTFVSCFYSLNRILSNVVCSNKLLEIGVWDVIRLNAFLCQVLVVTNCMNTFTVLPEYA